jgi:ribonuclease J
MDTFPNLKTSSEIKAMQKDFILTMTFWDLAELVDIVPKPGSCYIFSMSEPMNEEQELEFVKLVNWLDHYGLPQYHVHVSGHVLPHELRWLIQQTKPRITIPVHTEHPLLFKRLLRTLPTTVLIPRYGQSIEVL